LDVANLGVVASNSFLCTVGHRSEWKVKKKNLFEVRLELVQPLQGTRLACSRQQTFAPDRAPIPSSKLPNILHQNLVFLRHPCVFPQHLFTILLQQQCLLYTTHAGVIISWQNC